ncbi:MAG TPA: glycosyltransferase family 9 protein [Vitreimonas sp.]|uniref:glycosyltransferase family 9 protein n=1 Tax=Vitreimonas sp. TaxID=3069702 RepID=UPI002D3EC1F4|nr:glycosyltransferase family 9 protein [Vitreimonas sp.]HYD87309.1 glycosyltransferase family 9 protein [Vitreimonas sp.]
MASVLFLAPADLGETVLATGALAHALKEGDALTIVCARDAAPLFRAAPGLAALYPLAANAGLAARWSVWMQLAQRRFDLVLDGRGGIVGSALPARRRVALKPAAMLRHRVEEWTEALGAGRSLAPVLWLDDAARAQAAAIAPGAALLVLAPGGVSRAKRWPAERFAAVARRLASGPLANARVAALGAAARDASITRAMVASLDADGVAALDLGEGVDLLAAAALMERATLVIGNDNALSHIAAAMGAPTLALFGPTDERVRAPFGPRVRTLRGRSFEDIAASGALDAGAAMDDVSIDAVEAGALDLLHAGGLR